LTRLERKHFAGVTRALRARINRYYAPLDEHALSSRRDATRAEKIRVQLASLNVARPE
jgi:hypothetical protein